MVGDVAVAVHEAAVERDGAGGHVPGETAADLPLEGGGTLAARLIVAADGTTLVVREVNGTWV